MIAITYECPNCHQHSGHAENCPSWYDTEPPAPRAGEWERVEHSPLPWRVIVDDTGDPITGGYPSICADRSLDTTIIHVEGFHHEYWNSHPSQPVQVANAQLIVNAVNQHATLIKQRERLVDLLRYLKDTAFAVHVNDKHKPKAFAICEHVVCQRACQAWNEYLEKIATATIEPETEVK